MKPERPIRSMTGFASTRTQTAGGELTVSLRSVNGRNLDLHFHLNSEFAPFENALRALLKRKVERGHLEVRMSLRAGAANVSASYNDELLARYLRAFASANETYQLDCRPDLNRFLALPGMFDADAQAAAVPLSENEVVMAADSCADELNAFREREGAELLAAMEEQLAKLETAADQLAGIRQRASEELRARLEERLRELLGDAKLPASRLVEETAVLVDRSDIQEELTRLSVHSGEMRRMLGAGGEIGKRVDFLLQEMNRETNTILSKTSGVGETGLTVTKLGIGVKANIEKIREQALNLE